MEQYFYCNCFLDGKKENLHDAKGDSSDTDVLFTWLVRMIFPIDFRPSIGIQVSKGIFPIINNVIGIEKQQFMGKDSLQ